VSRRSEYWVGLSGMNVSLEEVLGQGDDGSSTTRRRDGIGGLEAAGSF